MQCSRSIRYHWSFHLLVFYSVIHLRTLGFIAHQTVRSNKCEAEVVVQLRKSPCQQKDDNLWVSYCYLWTCWNLKRSGIPNGHFLLHLFKIKMEVLFIRLQALSAQEFTWGVFLFKCRTDRKDHHLLSTNKISFGYLANYRKLYLMLCVSSLSKTLKPL